ncbi:AAA domain-containing protein [Lysobacter sp. Root690]|uniref:AAA domain-containing protein n=1 Tax=Lysobacter sp. Root690 TaxID=1736588 RepID=UPI000701F234|nr:AAA domain-containing protein [Lysobacter sp. Root690]KRB07025.1 hypothetical protein ASD86_13695 [Lysobacter sp. Root690]
MATLTLREKVAGGFLDQYQLDRKHLQKADKAKGIPGLRTGKDQYGQAVLVKVWPKENATSDADLREIWRNEMLQLHRIGGSPGAGDVIAELLNSGEDTQGFYLVLTTGRRRPLGSLSSGERRPDWLENPANASNKNLLWRNIKRLVQGLGALHGQGLLHRNVDRWAVLTDGGFDPDFQLTGFEWSIRLTGIQGNIRHPKGAAVQPGTESFLKDWEQLGELAVELFGLNRKTIGNIAIANHSVATAFAADEIKLLREMLRVLPVGRADADYVVERIDLILAGLGARAAGKGGKYHLALLLGPQSALSRAIRKASGGEAIELEDLDAQIAFVRDDLIQGARAFSLKLAGQPGRFKMVLQGSKLTYHLEDAVVGAERTPTGWRAASCDMAETGGPQANHVIRDIQVNGLDIEVSSAVGFAKRYRNNYATLSSWEGLREQLSQSDERDDIESLVRALWMAHLVECLFASSDAFPVEVVAQGQLAGKAGGDATLLIRARSDKDRETLSSALLLNDAPGKRLSAALTENDGTESGNWRLTELGQLGDRSPTDTEWRFMGEATAKDGSPAFEFVGDRAAPPLKKAFFVSTESLGRDFQLKRRLKYISALETHSELARMISNPRSRVFKSDESIAADDAFLSLDESKQAALRTIVETLPVFFVQGPPGVGKTRLVRDLVRRRFKDDPSTRMLLSAQSNYAVDHLLHELEKVLSVEANIPPLTIRCRAKDKRDETGKFDVGFQAKKIAEDFARSKLVECVDEELGRRASLLAKSYQVSAANDDSPDRFSQRAFEGLVLRSANAVFATTNSADLERLVEERGQFDWTVVEESAKATGGELLAPMLLSHRRLLIGDHKQLAAFGTEPMLRVFQSPKSLRKALAAGDCLIGRAFRSPAMDDLFAWIEEADFDEQEFADLCIEASRVLFLFEKFIEAELERQNKEAATSKAHPIAARLNRQHRMHPRIAELVSTVFYEDSLETDEIRRKHFETAVCPISSLDPKRLPDAPIVWIDMPWVQATKNKKDGDTSPRWNNSDERLAVLHALGLLSSTANKERPSVAVLSPYTQQVKLLEEEIQRAIGKQLGNLKAFEKAADGTCYSHTVDSFQGNEADAVVVSLVRNNSHGSVKRALGFLSNPRRMNVLLSRARWRLIIVGSLAFMQSAAAIAKSPQDAEEIAFLRKLLAVVTADGSTVRVVPFAALRGGSV